MTYGKKGLLVRLAYLATSLVFFVINKVKGGGNRGLVVLCYHGVHDVQKSKFVRQVRMLQHRVTSTTSAAKPSASSEKLSVCLTFDDAFTNLLSNVIPVITELQVPITIFIPTGSLGMVPSWLVGVKHPDSHETVLSAQQIGTLKGNPLVSFGSHTVDHPRLSSLNEREANRQLHSSKTALSELVGKEITDLALPHGDYNDLVLRLADKEGYRNVYTLEPKINLIANRAGTRVLGRFSVSPDDWPVEFYLTIHGAYSWLAPWRALISRFRH